MQTSPETPKPKYGLLDALAYLGKYPGQVCLSLGLLLVIIGLELVLPQIIGHWIDHIKSATAKDIATSSFAIAALFLTLGLIREVLRYILGPTRNRLIHRSLCDIRIDFFDSLQRQGFPYHGKANTGDLISRATSDVGKLQGFFFACMFMSVDIVVTMFATICIIFWIDPWLGLLVIGTTVPTVGLVAWFSKALGPRWQEVHKLHGRMTSVVQENITGVRVVKAFAKEKEEIGKFARSRDVLMSKALSAMDYWAARVPFAQFIYGLTMPLALGVGGYHVIEGTLSVGQLTKVVFYIMAINHRMGSIGRFMNMVHEASAGATRILEVIHAPHELPDGTKDFPAGEVAITFEKVSFAHTPDRNALSDVSFTIPAGRCVAVVGPTGAGKTTLVNLIPRFYDPAAGKILIGGIDVREFKLHSLRQNIGVIFQESFLFSATVSENLAYGRPDATEEEIIKSARAAQAHDFIEDLPNGYNTVIGERGISLSGGQKQRIAIARAFLLNPRILILDDATASVDPRTEQKIQESIRKLCVGRTVFIIAHRLSTVTFANEVLVLNEGHLVEKGTHQELITRDGFYQKLIESQMQHDLIPSP